MGERLSGFPNLRAAVADGVCRQNTVADLSEAKATTSRVLLISALVRCLDRIGTSLGEGVSRRNTEPSLRRIKR